MVNACTDPDFFLSEGGGGVQARRRENNLIFLCLFWGFLVQNFPGMRGSNYLRGGGGGPNANFYRI